MERFAEAKHFMPASALAVSDKSLQTGRLKPRKVKLNTNLATIKSDSTQRRKRITNSGGSHKGRKVTHI